MEGYFHTLPGDLGPVASPNVRSGVPSATPPAPRRLRAFAEALRRRNRRLLEDLAKQCPGDGGRVRPVIDILIILLLFFGIVFS